jgi:hypothetical protein
MVVSRVNGGPRVIQRSRYAKLSEESGGVLTPERKQTIQRLGLGLRVNQGTDLGSGNMYVLNCFPSASDDGDWEAAFAVTMGAIAKAGTMHDSSRNRRLLLLDHCDENAFWGQYLGRGTVGPVNQVLAETGLYGTESAQDVTRWVLRQIDARAQRTQVTIEVQQDAPAGEGCWASFCSWVGNLFSCPRRRPEDDLT